MALSLQGQRIFFIFWGSELGGAERQGVLFARYMKFELGADVHVWGLGAKGTGRVTELCTEYGLPWLAVAFDWSNNRRDRLRELFRFALRLRKERPDILLPYTWLPNVVCGLTWRFTGARTCLWNQRDEGRGLNTGLWHRWAVRLISNFVSNSTIGKEALIKLYGISENSIKVIHNGVFLADPVNDRATWRNRLGIPLNCIVATMVANLHANKDHPTLMRAWRIVLERDKDIASPPPVLLLAGRFDNRVNELKAVAYDLELGKSVRFLGKVDDIAGLLLASDLCIHSSLTEGLPNGILEAMATGLPVVATDISGIREVVGDDNQQYLAEARNDVDLADKVMLFLKDSDLCHEVGIQNRNIVEQKFSVDKMCREMTEILDGKRAVDNK
jgi:glycosyltransferase involved in cell wall biosynthesis